MRMADRMNRLLTRHFTHDFQPVTSVKPLPYQEEGHQHQSNEDKQ
jgi:hypothetical protein